MSGQFFTVAMFFIFIFMQNLDLDCLPVRAISRLLSPAAHSILISLNRHASPPFLTISISISMPSQDHSNLNKFHSQNHYTPPTFLTISNLLFFPKKKRMTLILLLLLHFFRRKSFINHKHAITTFKQGSLLYSNSRNGATPFFCHKCATPQVLHIYGKTKALHHCGNYCTWRC